MSGAFVVYRVLNALFISFPARILSHATLHTAFFVWYDNFRRHLSRNNRCCRIWKSNNVCIWPEGRNASEFSVVRTHRFGDANGFFTYRSEKKYAERKEREERLVSHGNKIIKDFIDFHYERLGLGRVSRKPIELCWRDYFELFTYHKELLQHLHTGHNDLYSSLDKNQAKFEHDLDELIRGIALDVKTLRGACDQCIDLHDKKEASELRISLSKFSA
jgi:hypothetical protein